MNEEIAIVGLCKFGLFVLGAVVIVILFLPLFLSRTARRESRLEQEGEDAVSGKRPRHWSFVIRKKRDCRACSDWRCQCHIPHCPLISGL